MLLLEMSNTIKIYTKKNTGLARFFLPDTNFLRDITIKKMIESMPILQDIRITFFDQNATDIFVEGVEDPKIMIQLRINSTPQRVELFLNLLQRRYLQNVFEGLSVQQKMIEIQNIWKQTEIMLEIPALKLCHE